MRLLSITIFLALFLTPALSEEKEKLRIFVVTIFAIHPKGIETSSVWDRNIQKDVKGDHFIKIDTSKSEFYDGQELTVHVRKDGTITSDDGTLTLRAWKPDPNYEIKLHD